MEHFPPKFSKSHSFETAVRIENIKQGAKMVRTSSIYMQSLNEIRRCTSAWETKVGCFCFFVCLFVMLWILKKGLVIQIAILSPFVG